MTSPKHWVFLTAQTDSPSSEHGTHSNVTEAEKDTAEPEGPVLFDSCKTIQHSFMQIKYVSLPPQEGSTSIASSFMAFQGNQGDPSIYSAWGTVGIMTGGEGETVDN